MIEKAVAVVSAPVTDVIEKSWRTYDRGKLPIFTSVYALHGPIK